MELIEMRKRAGELGIVIKALLEGFEEETQTTVKEVALARQDGTLRQVLLDVKLL